MILKDHVVDEIAKLLRQLKQITAIFLGWILHVSQVDSVEKFVSALPGLSRRARRFISKQLEVCSYLEPSTHNGK